MLTSDTPRPIPDSSRGGPWSWPRKLYQKAANCLGWRLIFVLSGSLLVLLTASSWLSLRLHRGHMVAALEESVIGMGETILSSAHSSMLRNDQQHLGEIIHSIGTREDVLSVRLVDARGNIRYSSEQDEVGQVADLEAPACQGCHAGDTPHAPTSLREGLNIYPLPTGQRTLGLAVPVLNSEDCWSADCHVHPRQQQVLGVLDLELSTATMDQALLTERRHAIAVAALTILIICTTVGLLTWRVLHRPFHELLDGTRQLASGDLSHRVRTPGIGELGELASSFNLMAERLGLAKAELEDWGHTLEQRVAEKSHELERTRDQMVFTEKMASLGKLAAIVAHEINNPLAGILVSTKLVRRRLPRLCGPAEGDGKQEMDETLSLMEKETARCGDIVRNLLLFSRRRELSAAPEDLNQMARRCVRLVQHQFDLQEIVAQVDLDESLPEVICDGAQIEQACLALIMNAIEAMPDGGTLGLRTRHLPETDLVRIEISDTGVGIAEEMRPRIFEPFFSTKKEGNGTGLGLAVMYGIIQRHKGTVDFSSQPGQGTDFWIELPVQGGGASTFSESQGEDLLDGGF